MRAVTAVTAVAVRRLAPDRSLLLTTGGAALLTGVAAALLCGRPGVAVFAATTGAVVSGAAVLWSRWRAGRVSVGGVLLLFPVGLVLAFGVGGTGHRVEYLGVRVGDATYLLAAGGVLAFVLGVRVAAVRGPVGLRRPALPSPSRAAAGVVLLAGACGVLVSWVNFATGSIPLFADDVLAARLAPDPGALAKLTAVATGAQQFAVLAGLLIIFSPTSVKARLWTGAGVFVVLATVALSGSRSFLVLPLAASALVLLERWRPRAVVVVGAGAAAVALMGLVGLYRVDHAIDVSYRKAYLVEHGFGTTPFGVAWNSLQTGPRITELALRRVPDDVPFQHGYFFVRDGSALLPIAAEPADRWVTTAIFREPLAKQGGTPPTVLGGLYIDFGVPGVLLGLALAGWLMTLLRAHVLRRATLGASVLFGYLAAYLCLSIYSYLSLKTTVVVVVALCGLTALAAHAWSRPDVALAAGSPGTRDYAGRAR